MNWFLKQSKRFVHDQSGSVALLLLFAFLLVFGSIALAIDATRYISLHSRALLAAQTGASAAVQNRDILNEGNLTELAREFAELTLSESSHLTSNSPVTILSSFSLDLLDDRSVLVKLSVKFSVTLMQTFNILDELEVRASALAKAEIHDTEITFIVDRSAQVAASGKLETLKASAVQFSEFVDDLSDSENTVRLGIVPMGDQLVNIKPYGNWVLPGAWPIDIPPSVPGIADWVGPLTEQHWCVDVRSGAGAETDISPSLESFLLMFEVSKDTGETPESDRYFVTTSLECTDIPIRPLKSDFVQMKSYLSNLDGHGDIAAGRALLWGERMLSPDWQVDWALEAGVPALYGENVRKVVVFVWASNSVVSVEESRIFTETCDRLKGKGAIMYMVNFDASPDAAERMKECASAPGHYYHATDGNSISRSFKEIVRSMLTYKRLKLTETGFGIPTRLVC